MIRALTGLALALLSLTSPLASARSSTPHEFALAASAPVPQKNADAVSLDDQKLAQFEHQQQTAQQQIDDAIRTLAQQITRLEQMRAAHPSSPDLIAAISALQARFNQLQQANAELRQNQSTWNSQNSRLAGDAKVTALAAQTQRWTQISSLALAEANESTALADKAVANLKPSPTAEEPMRANPRPTPTTRPTPAVPVDRSPASVPPPPPPPSETPTTIQHGQPAGAAPSAPSHRHPPVQQEQPTTMTAPPPEPASTRPDEMQWFNQLKNGLLQYSVPQTMLWKVPSTVTVQISGEQAPPSGPIDSQSGQAPIKVARHVKVLVSAPDNPDEFTIAPESDTQIEQYVPPDGSTTWHYSVTPRYTGSAQKLVVQAWVVYDKNTQRELPVYRTAINIHVPGFFECVKLLFEGDPDYWLKYGLPGGAGFVFVSGAVVGLWKWLKKKKHRAPEPVNP